MRYTLGLVLCVLVIGCDPEERQTPIRDPQSRGVYGGTGTGSGTASSSPDGGMGNIMAELCCSIWNDLTTNLCSSLTAISDAAISTFCNLYLDAKGIPASGLKRTIGRSICISKVKHALQSGMCTIRNVFYDAGPRPPG